MQKSDWRYERSVCGPNVVCHETVTNLHADCHRTSTSRLTRGESFVTSDDSAREQRSDVERYDNNIKT